MKKRYISLATVSCLLAGCSSGMPEELSAYLQNCHMNEAYDWVDNIELVYTSQARELVSGKPIGEQKVYYLQEKKDPKDLYAYYDGVYSGIFVTDRYPEDAEEPNLTSLRHIRCNDGSKYVAERIINGRSVPDLVLTYDEMYGSLLSYFYNDIQSNYYLGGMYYADALKLSKAYHRYMSIDEDNIFIYKLVDVGSVNEKDEVISRVNETFRMNDKGMLLSHDIVVEYIEEKPYTIITSSLSITYNSDSFSRITDLETEHPFFKA